MARQDSCKIHRNFNTSGAAELPQDLRLLWCRTFVQALRHRQRLQHGEITPASHSETSGFPHLANNVNQLRLRNGDDIMGPHLNICKGTPSAYELLNIDLDYRDVSRGSLIWCR